MAALKRIACLLGAQPLPPDCPRALLDVALAHSPRVESAGAGLVYLDVTGLRGLFGDDAQIGRRLVTAAADRGLVLRVGVAGGRIAALAAARGSAGVSVVAPGRDAESLESAPLAMLDLSGELAARFGAWGIRTLGELAALPTAPLFERLGSEGLRLQRLARGEDPRPLQPWKPSLVLEESRELDEGIVTLGPLVDLLAQLAGRACETLMRRGLSADRFEWICWLADRSAHEGSSAPAVPTNDPAAVALLLKAALESRPPQGAVQAVTVRVCPVRVAPAQASLDGPSCPSPRMLPATLLRLTALPGSLEIGIPVLLDSHRPDAVVIEPVLSSRESDSPPGEIGAMVSAVLALRRLRPPCPAAVTLTGGRPIHLRCDRLTARIVASAGPWRVSGEWWSERPWRRDEWDAELGDGTLCRLAHDGSSWWLEGIYD